LVGRERLGEVAQRAAVDDVGEVAFEVAAGLLVGVAGLARLVERLGAWFAAQLRDEPSRV
jgi:hypothetical protein